eukprot:6374412-Alexandrium_andersonii.AAC.1
MDHAIQEGAESPGHLVGDRRAAPAHHEREQARIRADPARAREARPTRGGEGLGVGHPKGSADSSPG